MDWITRARTLAADAHAGQLDKAGQPYLGHVSRVAARVSSDPNAEVVAWLHDVVEDHADFATQVEDFPAPLREAVLLLSRNTAPDPDTYYARIAGTPWR